MTAAIVGNERTDAMASSARHDGGHVDSRLAAVGDAATGLVKRLPERDGTRLADLTDGRRRR